MTDTIRHIGELLLVTPGSCKRHEMALGNAERLSEMAHGAIYTRGLTPWQFVMALVQVDDPRWTGIVDELMPGHDWQQYRDRGEEPLARGSTTFSLCEYLAEEMPGIASALLERPQKGYVKVVVLGEGGGNVYEISI